MKVKSPAAILLLALLLAGFVSLDQPRPASAAQTITAYKAQVPVTLNGQYVASQWSDTPLINEQFSGMTVAFKQNGTGLIWLMEWKTSSPYCTDSACFGGIELGFLNNTQPMGDITTPTIMVLASTSFPSNVDEFISTGTATPQTVESAGYKTQSTCGLTLASGQYIVDCYRPFKLNNGYPHDPFSSFAAGNAIELGFAVGEFTNPGDHLASDMATYVIQTSTQMYTPSSTSKSTSTTSSTSTSSGSSTSASTTTAKTSSSATSSSSGTPTTSSSTASSTSSASTSSTTTSSTAVTSVVTTSSGPTTASTYAEELIVLTVGFTVLILVTLTKYERS